MALGSDLGSILRLIQAGDARPVRIRGATSAAKALISLETARARRCQVLLLCANMDEAVSLHEDALALRHAGFGVGEALLFPTWERSPRAGIAPAAGTRIERISALASLLENPGPSVVVASLSAALQATIPRDELEARTCRLAPGTDVGSPAALGIRFENAGYVRGEIAEDPGSYSVRGEIVDVFPPGRSRPRRIELFDRVIDRIREYDPSTQLSIPDSEAAGTLAVAPCREVLPNAAGIAERFKAWADENGVQRSRRDPVMALLRSGGLPAQGDAWAPFAYSAPGCLLDYLGPDSAIIWDDRESATAATRELEVATGSEELLPPHAALYPWESRKVGFDGRAVAEFERLSLEEHKAGGSISILLESNEDIDSARERSLDRAASKFADWKNAGYSTFLFASTTTQLERITHLLDSRGARFFQAVRGTLSRGFRWPAEKLALVAEGELLGAPKAAGFRKARKSAVSEWSGISSVAELDPGDRVIHATHGLGLYRGLTLLASGGVVAEYLAIEYEGGDRLYLPVYRMNLVQRYAGEETAKLDSLGGSSFEKAKEKARQSARKLAFDLLDLYARRTVSKGAPLSIREEELGEFEAKFPFDETPDQVKATHDILSDLASGRVMDRLLCGDVGFGKTEIAMRASFVAVSAGKQVAVLVPTTILAQQHETTFRARFRGYPVRIESLSRFKPPTEQERIIEDAGRGSVDILIGTHRLLSGDVRFRALGLLVVDEEHRFGVEHKEKIKAMKAESHTLTMTATPIPRTLHMALSGLREITLMKTPPSERLPIRTFLAKDDDGVVRSAVDLELKRGGQVFYLHNRVQSIHEAAERIRRLAPGARIRVAHGQMPEKALETTMREFQAREVDILVCTSIIEAGIDLPSANTLIVQRADLLGLAQLYQIRGRIGRSSQKAYAYLLIPSEGTLSEDAKRRLEVIQRFVELGSGFAVASRDLEIRGGGDILGPEQSGHVAAVGFELYLELLEQAVREIRSGGRAVPAEAPDPEIQMHFPALLPQGYVESAHLRLSVYRQLSGAKDEADLARIESELEDRFGKIPPEAANLFWLIRIKILLRSRGIIALRAGPGGFSLTVGPESRVDPAKAIALASGEPGTYSMSPDSKFSVKRPAATVVELLALIDSTLASIGSA